MLKKCCLVKYYIDCDIIKNKVIVTFNDELSKEDEEKLEKTVLNSEKKYVNDKNLRFLHSFRKFVAFTLTASKDKLSIAPISVECEIIIKV